MNSDNHFRSVPFGGFNKEDVLKYIEQIKTELVVYRNNSEQQIQELVKRIEVLETQLNASNAKIKEYESIIHENRNISEKRAVSSSPFNMSPIDVPEDNNVPHFENEEEEEEPETSKTNEGQIHDEFRICGFKIEDAILLEQDGSKFNAENTQEAQAGYAVPEPEKGIAEEERVPGVLPLMKRLSSRRARFFTQQMRTMKVLKKHLRLKLNPNRSFKKMMDRSRNLL
jgi:cell division septum initiation protein DivIVA